MTMRLYSADELGRDGYPPEWHKVVKHAVREKAGHRCVRCLHPYGAGAGEWSPCDDRCVHAAGEIRIRYGGAREEWEVLAAGDVMLLQAYGAEVEARYRILTVHHLDGDKGNCRWWNLAALCQRCHLQIQGKVKMERIWPWEHSEWFQPYVAGYYAFVYLGEDLTRAETVARLDELLALERAA
jgi:hypothetical protein